MSYSLQFGQIANDVPFVLGGIWSTLWISFATFWLAAILGLGIALAKTSSSRVLRVVAGLWVVVFTFSPLYLLLFFLFNVLPEVGIYLSSLQATLIGFTLAGSAYLAEIERAGIVSVRQAELDSAAALGMSGFQTVRFVIAPHVARTAYAPMSNWFILTVLGTSMASLIGLDEVTGRALAVSARTFRSIEIFIVVAGIYIVLTLIASLSLALVGRWTFRVRLRLI